MGEDGFVTKKSIKTSHNPQLAPSVLKVYPNPASEYCTFEYDIPEVVGNKGLVINIVSMEGKSIENININSLNGIYNLDVSKYANGSYIYKFVSNGYQLESGTFIVK